MKYLMLVCTDPDHTPAENDGAPTIEAWVDEMNARGTRLLGDRTRPSTEATSVRVRNREVLLTDGPYAETKEVLGGFWVIRAENLDEALQWASKASKACAAPVEVRPFQGE